MVSGSGARVMAKAVAGGDIFGRVGDRNCRPPEVGTTAALPSTAQSRPGRGEQRFPGICAGISQINTAGAEAHLGGNLEQPQSDGVHLGPRPHSAPPRPTASRACSST